MIRNPLEEAKGREIEEVEDPPDDPSVTGLITIAYELWRDVSMRASGASVWKQRYYDLERTTTKDDPLLRKFLWITLAMLCFCAGGFVNDFLRGLS